MLEQLAMYHTDWRIVTFQGQLAFLARATVGLYNDCIYHLLGDLVPEFLHE